jgi:hypothetical protein
MISWALDGTASSKRALAAIHHERAHEPLRVAVIYGAAHMLAVIEALRTLGYQPSTSEWLTVFHC